MPPHVAEHFLKNAKHGHRLALVTVRRETPVEGAEVRAILPKKTLLELARLMGELSPKEFAKIQPDALKKDFQAIVAGSHEDSIYSLAEAGGGAGAAPGAR